MVAERVREPGDLGRVVKLRQQGRSGDVPDHQEDEPGEYQPGEDQPGDRAHQDSPESVH